MIFGCFFINGFPQFVIGARPHLINAQFSDVAVDHTELLRIGTAHSTAEARRKNLHHQLHAYVGVEERVGVHVHGEQHLGVLGQGRAGTVGEHNDPRTGILRQLHGLSIHLGIPGEAEQNDAVLLANVAHMVDDVDGALPGGNHIGNLMAQQQIKIGCHAGVGTGGHNILPPGAKQQVNGRVEGLLGIVLHHGGDVGLGIHQEFLNIVFIVVGHAGLKTLIGHCHR